MILSDTSYAKKFDILKTMDIVYNRFGSPEIFYIPQAGRFIGLQGQSLGFLNGRSVFNYGGRQVGTFEGGILRDNNGNTVGFIENPTSTPRPLLPYLFNFYRPTNPIVSIEPVRPITLPNPFNAFNTFYWSLYSPSNLFIGV